MLPQEAAYGTYHIQNILFNDREDISLFLSLKGKANEEKKLEEVEEKDRKKNKQDLEKRLDSTRKYPARTKC